MKKIIVPTFQATIWLGLREGYNEPTHAPGEVLAVCQAYCDGVSLCVTVTPTTFVYKGGREPGLAIGLINYPRFPSIPNEVREHAIRLAKKLKEHCGQFRVTVIIGGETIMLGTP